MTKGRKTAFEERVEIVGYCIAHVHNYAETAENYQVSYQQARSYTIKYESGGVEAFIFKSSVFSLFSIAHRKIHCNIGFGSSYCKPLPTTSPHGAISACIVPDISFITSIS